MSKIALADAQREWAEILDGLDTVAGLDKPDLHEMRGELAAMAAAARALAADQAELESRRQWTTQQLRITRRRAQDLVIQIKAAVKGALGHRSEMLTRFGIRPTRTRKKREEVGIAYYPRPDLLATIGLTQAPPAPSTAGRELSTDGARAKGPRRRSQGRRCRDSGSRSPNEGTPGLSGGIMGPDRGLRGLSAGRMGRRPGRSSLGAGRRCRKAGGGGLGGGRGDLVEWVRIPGAVGDGSVATVKAA